MFPFSLTMPSEPANASRPPFWERFWLVALLLVVFMTRAPFLDMGFGRGDAWRVGVTGKFWVEYGEYEPSRLPGFPLIETASALSYALFRGSPITWTATNVATCLLFCLSVFGIWLLARRWDVPVPLLVAAIYAFAPLNWVYSVETTDYLWMSSLLVMSVVALESKGGWSPVWSGVLLGLAAAARFSAGFMLVPLLILVRTKRRSWRDVLLLALPFALVACGFYAVVFLQLEDVKQYFDWIRYLNRVTSGLAELEGGTFARRFLMPATDVFGPLATIALVLAGLWGLPKLLKLLLRGDRGSWVGALMAFFIMAPYLWHMHPNYWIPAIGFLVLLLGKMIRPKALMVVGALVVAANFPAWQARVERLEWLVPMSENSFGSYIAPYQNETVFTETKVRLHLWGTVEDLLAQEMPSDWIIMSGLRLPLIKFLVRDIRRVDMPLKDGGSLGAWGSPEGGARYVYLLSPAQVEAATASGYHAVYLPGMENMYYAEHRVHIHEVEGVEVLTYGRGESERANDE